MNFLIASLQRFQKSVYVALHLHVSQFSKGFFLLLLRTWISAALHFNAQAQQRPWRGAMGAAVPVPCVDRPERTPETSVAERGLPAIVLRADARPSPDQPDAEIL